VHVSPAISAAMERITERAEDVQRSFTPGAQPAFDDAGRAQTTYPTLDPLSVAPPPGAYFVTRGENGDPAYTRDGSFALRDGALYAGDRPVLGFDARGTLRDVRVDTLDAALGRASNARIDARGDLVYERDVVDPRTGGAERRRVIAGRVALARFPAGTRLVESGGALEAPAGTVVQYGAPGEGGFANVATGRRESSGVDVDRSLDRLRIAYRELDAMQSVYRAQYGVDKTAMDVVK